MIEVFATTTQVVLDATVVSATGFFGYCFVTDIWHQSKYPSALPSSESKPLDGASIASKPERTASEPALLAAGNGASVELSSDESQPQRPSASPTPHIFATPATPAFLPPQPSMPELEPARRAASTALIPYQPHTLKIESNGGSKGRALVVSPQKSLMALDAKTRARETATDGCAPIAEVAPTPPQRTELAGFWCLLALQERLGAIGFLEAHPYLKAVGFSQQLLWNLGERLGIPADDPVRLPLPEIPEAIDEAPYPFVAPTLWQQGIYHHGTWSVHRAQEQPGVRVLFDGSGHLAVALWYEGNRDLEAIREAIGGRQILRGAPLSSTLDLAFLLQMWTIAMRRWCRRFARLGLQDLVAQPGWVYLTPTQIVVELDSESLDRRVRQAGLNLDVKALPGWERDLVFD